jgi:hypothetical protein
LTDIRDGKVVDTVKIKKRMHDILILGLCWVDDMWVAVYIR